MQSYSKRIRYRVEYAVFLSVAAIFRALPVETASAISGWLWRHIASRTSRHKRALNNLALAFPDKALAAREVIAHDMWENLGRTFAEAFHLREIATSDRIFVENAAEIEGFNRKVGGKLYCSGHFANWELIVAGMGRHGIKPMAIYQIVKNPLVDAYLLKERTFLYTGGLFPKDNQAARHLIRGARKGADAAVLVDLRDHSGVSVDFFGRPAPSSPFPALMVQMLDVPVYMCSFVREANVRFRLNIQPIALQRAENREADVATITASIQAEIEKIVRANPAQWMWAHRRWGR